MIATTEQKAYLAGIIDGEGCIRICKQRPRAINRDYSTIYFLRIEVRMVDREAIDFLKSVFGGGVYVYKNHKSSKPVIFDWIVSHRNAVKIIKDIYPYLRVKKNQADLALKFSETIGKVGRNKNGTSKKLTNRILSIREHLFEEMKKAKKTYQSYSFVGGGEY